MLIFDLTTLTRWDRPPVGIVRVELELLKYILKHLDEMPCVFVCFSAQKTELKTINCQSAMSIIKRIEQKNYPPPLLKKNNHSSRTPFLSDERIKRIAQFILPKKYHPYFERAWGLYRSLGFFKFLKRVIRYLSPKLASLWREKNNKNLSEFNDKVYDFDFTPNQGDVFISVGLTWDHFGYELAYFMKKKWHIKIAGISYDMIPITHPEYIHNDQLNAYFFKHFYYLNYLFDRIGCISDFSKSEFMRLTKEYNFSLTPLLKTTYLGDKIVKMSQDSTALNQADLPDKPYVLFISTVEARKNHLVLIKAWLLAYERKIAMPDLICVGMMGWGIEPMLALYKDHAFLKEKIHFFNYVNDTKLINLYKNCLFTVFPSYVEGWGLGAAESLNYGKVCIISKAEALNEATQNLMPRIDADDVETWMKTIAQLANDKNQRDMLELKIKEKFIPRAWEAFAEEFISFATEQQL